MQEVFISIERPYKSLSTDKLIEGLQKTKEQNKLRLLQTEFYSRFAPYVFKIALNRFSTRRDGTAMAKEVVQDTFKIACVKISDFTFPEGVDLKKVNYVLMAWIGKIANIVVSRVLESYSSFEYEELEDEKEGYDDDEATKEEAVFFSLDEDPIEVPSEYMVKLRAAMNQLNEKQRDVILAYAEEGCISSGKHLSEEKMRSLCKIFNTSPENIRQIKKRALDKLKALCAH